MGRARAVKAKGTEVPPDSFKLPSSSVWVYHQKESLEVPSSAPCLHLDRLLRGPCPKGFCFGTFQGVSVSYWPF